MDKKMAGGAVVWLVFVIAIMGESWILENNTMTTVTGFEIEEAGLPAVLANAIEDQRAVVDYIQKRQDIVASCRLDAQTRGLHGAEKSWARDLQKVDRVLFQSIRVLGLLEAMSEREAGRVS